MKFIYLSLFLLASQTTNHVVASDLSKPHELWNEANKTTVKTLLHQPQSKLSSDKSVVNVGNFISRQVNVNTAGQNTLRDAANEPSIAVNPLNPQRAKTFSCHRWLPQLKHVTFIV